MDIFLGLKHVQDMKSSRALVFLVTTAYFGIVRGQTTEGGQAGLFPTKKCRPA